MSIDSSLYSRLTSTTAITDLVGSRITKGWRSNDAGLPAVILVRSSSTPFGSSSGSNSNWNIEFDITIEAETQDAARTIADLISTTLRGWKSTDPVSGPFRLQQDADNVVNPVTGENYGYGRITQSYVVTLKL